MDPENPMAWTNLSRYYAQAGRIEDAEQAKGKALYLSWKQKAGEAKAVQQAEQDETERRAQLTARVELFEQVLDLDADDVVANFGLGKLYLDLGEFQKADGGTLFLDELGELPMALQAKVLRAVEQGEVQPLGSNKAPARVDVRFICATNRDLATMVRERAFRDDLYYRLSVMTMDLPPLRTYKDDNLETLAHVFLQQSGQKLGKGVLRISAEAMALMKVYDFPGNVRELAHVVERSILMAQGPAITAADLGLRERSESGSSLENMTMDDAERHLIQKALDRCGGNVSEAAETLGLSRSALYRRLQRHGISDVGA